MKNSHEKIVQRGTENLKFPFERHSWILSLLKQLASKSFQVTVQNHYNYVSYDTNFCTGKMKRLALFYIIITQKELAF